MALNPGSHIGPYEIVAPIGVGGMGEVYRARDSRLNRDVAVKVLPASVAQDPERLARFRREAQLLASLNHPNIAHIHGFEDEGNSHALVMELVEGPTLADRIAQGPIPIGEALPIAKQIAEAMEAAHEQGVIHRDLKPSNIKVRDDGTVKVLDFGLAKAMTGDSSSGGADPSASPTLTARATQLGVILGTAAYMAPEQAKGRPVDRRADIWAFGVVLFEMLTGRRGYDAEDISETLAAVLTREVDWAALPPTTPGRLKALVRDCLVRDPKQRLRDIGDARRALESMMAGGLDDVAATAAAASLPPIAARKGAAWLPWTIAALAVMAAAIASAIALRPAPVVPGNVTRSEVILKGFSALVTVSRDGKRIAYTVAGGPSGTFLAMRMVDQFEAKPISGTDGGAWPLFSPDGQWIVYAMLNGNQIKKIPVTGGTASTLAEGSFGSGAAWAADDTIIFSAAKGLVSVSANGGTPAPLTTVNTGKGELLHTRPQLLPGEKQLLFTIEAKDPTGPQFAVMDLPSGTPRVVARGGLNGRYAPTGHLTYDRGGTLFAVPFDLKTLQITGSEVPVIENVSEVGPAGTADYAFGDDGLLAYFATAATGSGTTLAWVDRDGKTTNLPGQSSKPWGTGRLSPDGRFVANGISDSSGDRDVWIYDVVRGTPTRVSFGGNNDTPIWTRDSRHIYYASSRDGKFAIYRAPADASAKPELILTTATASTTETISPDGRTLIYSLAGEGQKSQLMAVGLDATGKAGDPKPLHDTNALEVQAEFSPDGRWLAYTSLESGAPEVYVHAFPQAGAKVRVSTEGGQRPRWSRDGKELFYLGGSPGSRMLSVQIPNGDALRPSAPKTIVQILMGTTWDTSPDSNKFLIELTTRGDGVNLSIVTNWFEELKRRAPAKK